MGIIDVHVDFNNRFNFFGFFNNWDGTPAQGNARTFARGVHDTSYQGGNGQFQPDAFSGLTYPDGKVLVLGGFDYTDHPTIPNIRAIARLNEDGTPDGTFNPGTGFGSVTAVTLYGLRLSNDQTLIFGFFFSYDGNSAAHIARLNQDGTYDSTFNTAGNGFNGPSVFAEFYDTFVNDITSRIVVGGAFTTYNGITHNRIIRLNPDGTVDNTFVSGTGFDDDVRAIAVQPDGKILVGGNFLNYNGNPAPWIIRLNGDGSIDNTFNPGTGFDSSVENINIQKDGQIVVNGWFTQYDGQTHNRIVRLNSDGSVDNSFRTGTGFNFITRSAKILGDGRIIVVGDFTAYNGQSANRVALLNTEGELLPETESESSVSISSESTLSDLSSLSSLSSDISTSVTSSSSQSEISVVSESSESESSGSESTRSESTKSESSLTSSISTSESSSDCEWRTATLTDIPAAGYWGINFNDPRVLDLLVRNANGSVFSFTDPDTGIVFQENSGGTSGIILNDPEAKNRYALSIRNDGSSDTMRYGCTTSFITYDQGFMGWSGRVEDPASFHTSLGTFELPSTGENPAFQLRNESGDVFSGRTFSTTDGVRNVGNKSPANITQPFAAGLNWDRNDIQNCNTYFMDGDAPPNNQTIPFSVPMSFNTLAIELLRSGGAVGNNHTHAIHGWSEQLTGSNLELWAAINAWASGPNGVAILDPSNPYKNGRPQYCEATGQFRANPNEVCNWRTATIRDIPLRGLFGSFVSDPSTEFNFTNGNEVVDFSRLDQMGGRVAATSGNRRGVLAIDPETNVEAIRSISPSTGPGEEAQPIRYADLVVPSVDIFADKVSVFAAWRVDDPASSFNAAQLIDVPRDTFIQARDNPGDFTRGRFSETNGGTVNTTPNLPAFAQDLVAIGAVADRVNKEGWKHLSFEGITDSTASGPYTEGGLYDAIYLEINASTNGGALGHFYHYGFLGWSDDATPFADEIFGILAWTTNSVNRLSPGNPGSIYINGRPMYCPETGEFISRDLLPELVSTSSQSLSTSSSSSQTISDLSTSNSSSDLSTSISSDLSTSISSDNSSSSSSHGVVTGFNYTIFVSGEEDFDPSSIRIISPNNTSLFLGTISNNSGTTFSGNSTQFNGTPSEGNWYVDVSSNFGDCAVHFVDMFIETDSGTPIHFRKSNALKEHTYGTGSSRINIDEVKFNSVIDDQHDISSTSSESSIVDGIRHFGNVRSVYVEVEMVGPSSAEGAYDIFIESPTGTRQVMERRYNYYYTLVYDTFDTEYTGETPFGNWYVDIVANSPTSGIINNVMLEIITDYERLILNDSSSFTMASLSPGQSSKDTANRYLFNL